MRLLEKAIGNLSQKIAFSTKLNKEVSKKDVSWHIDHSLIVIINVCDFLQKSNPNNYKPTFNLIKSGVLLTGVIPRGKGRIPKAIINEEKITLEQLNEAIQKAIDRINNLKNLPKNSNFKHPYFGFMNLKTSIKFLRIHTNHHLKIINDILSE